MSCLALLEKPMKSFASAGKLKRGVTELGTALSLHLIRQGGEMEMEISPTNRHSLSVVQSLMILVTFLSFSRHWLVKDGVLIDIHYGIQWEQIKHPWNVWGPSRDMLLLLLQRSHRTRNKGQPDSETAANHHSLEILGCVFLVFVLNRLNALCILAPVLKRQSEPMWSRHVSVLDSAILIWTWCEAHPLVC